MKINEITPSKPPTPEQQRIAGLQATKDRASQVLQAERKRQQVAKAQKTLATANQIKPTGLI